MHGGKPAKLNGKGKTTKPRPGKVPVSMTLGTTVERDLVARNKTSCSLIRIENDPKVASRRILKSSAGHPWKEVIYNWLKTIQTPKSVVLYYSSRQRRQETRTVLKTWHDFCPELQADSCCHGAISSRCVGWLDLRLPREQIGWLFGRPSAVMLSVWCLSGPFQGPQTNCNDCWLASVWWQAVWKDHRYNHSKQSQRSRSNPVRDQSRPSWPASKQLKSKFKPNYLKSSYFQSAVTRSVIRSQSRQAPVTAKGIVSLKAQIRQETHFSPPTNFATALQRPSWVSISAWVCAASARSFQNGKRHSEKHGYQQSAQAYLISHALTDLP